MAAASCGEADTADSNPDSGADADTDGGLFPQVDGPQSLFFDRQLGTKRVLVMILKFSDSQPIATREALVAEMAIVEASYESNSYGLLDMQFDVAEVLESPSPTSVYAQNYLQAQTDSLHLADQAGIDTTSYDKFVVFMPKVWDGNDRGRGFGRFAFLTTTGAELIVHELGHTNLWGHANFYRSPDAGDPLGAGGVMVEYGDKFDPMGENRGTVGFKQFGPWLKHRAGWLLDDNIEQVNDSGRFTIGALSDAPSAGSTHALRIGLGASGDFWLYHRKDPGVNDGVLVSGAGHAANGSSTLFDMRPTSLPTDDDWQDASLPLGATWSSEPLGISVLVIASSTTEVTVDVTLAADSPSRTSFSPSEVELIAPSIGAPLVGTSDVEARVFRPSSGTGDGAGIARVSLYLLSLEAASSITAVTPAVLDELAVGGGTIESPPYRVAIDTTQGSDGGHLLMVLVEDQQGGLKLEVSAHVVENSGVSF